MAVDSEVVSTVEASAAVVFAEADIAATVEGLEAMVDSAARLVVSVERHLDVARSAAQADIPAPDADLRVEGPGRATGPQPTLASLMATGMALEA